MRCFLIVIAFVLASALTHAADYVHVKTSWEINVPDQSYRNNDTKLSLLKSIAAFRLHEAKPAQSDGSAKFIYYGERGIITVYHEPRPLVGAPNPAKYVEASCSAMEEGNGKFDSKSFFPLQYTSGGKRASGRGVVYHFVHSRELQGKQIWDEFGSVQVGQFFVSYRGTFIEKSGLTDLTAFLRAIGIRKV